MVNAAAGQIADHVHDMRVVEMVFDEGGAVRLYECWCGAPAVEAAA